MNLELGHCIDFAISLGGALAYLIIVTKPFVTELKNNFRFKNVKINFEQTTIKINCFLPCLRKILSPLQEYVNYRKIYADDVEKQQDINQSSD